MKLKLLILFFPLSMFGQEALVDLVDPFIGTGGHGHTFPGTTMPFGMVQLSPDTRLEGWDGCSGYHYSDSVIYGFSHTHLSGTGVGDYCDLLLMPTQGDIQFNNGYKDVTINGYSSLFKKDSEHASPGYYQVHLDEDKIDVRLTSTERVGIHEYTFNQKDVSNLIIDLEHRDPLLGWSLKQISKHEIAGHRISRSWAEEQHFYFVLQTSQPFEMLKSMVGEQYKGKGADPTKMALRFKKLKKDQLIVKVGISAVSIDGARKNLLEEADHWNFDKYLAIAEQSWEKALSKINISGGSNEQRTIFYTALYHSMIAPNLFSDVDRKYRGTDLKVHTSNDDPVYTIFSLWDTFRATHPLYTIIEQKRTKEFISTFLKHYNDGGQLPVWELSANYTGCMIGYHSVSVILDAFIKGIVSDQKEKLLKAMVQSAERDKLGIPAYRTGGYIPAGIESESVSKTLEYAYDDWCIAMMADKLGHKEMFYEYIERAQYYKNLFNPSSGFMQSKNNGSWRYGFDPAEVNFNFTEANSWQYSMFVPQDIHGLVQLHGGADQFELKLDQLFEASSDLKGRHQSDITGLIGQYAHGNEPSHHMAYLYNYIGKPYKTQNWVAQILNELYSAQPDGLAGNEDCGQMSSWYVFSALGFYPVTPGMPYYAIGTPLFDKAVINLENHNVFSITALNKSPDNIYIQNTWLNGNEYYSCYLQHEDILNGGELIIELGPEPNQEWGNQTVPPSSISKEDQITAVPFFTSASATFSDSLKVGLRSADKSAILFFKEKTANGFQPYNKPFYIYSSSDLEAMSVLDEIKSKVVSASYNKIGSNKRIELMGSYDNQYNGGGDNALIDGLKGLNNFRTGSWQGYQEGDLEAIVDLGIIRSISHFSLGTLQDIKSWIWFPHQVIFSVSRDNISFQNLEPIINDFPDQQYGAFIKEFELKLDQSVQCRYVRVKAINYGKCPEWHLGNGGKAWLFADEIKVD